MSRADLTTNLVFLGFFIIGLLVSYAVRGDRYSERLYIAGRVMTVFGIVGLVAYWALVFLERVLT